MLICIKGSKSASASVHVNLRFPFAQSGQPEQSVLKWNARVLRTGSGLNDPAHGSEPLSSPTPVGQSV